MERRSSNLCRTNSPPLSNKKKRRTSKTRKNSSETNTDPTENKEQKKTSTDIGLDFNISKKDEYKNNNQKPPFKETWVRTASAHST